MIDKDDIDLPSERSKHDLAAKAVSNPIRKRMLEMVLEGNISESDLIEKLVAEGLIPDGSHFKYHMSFLLKAECVAKKGEVYVITKAGEVVKFM